MEHGDWVPVTKFDGAMVFPRAARVFGTPSTSPRASAGAWIGYSRRTLWTGSCACTPRKRSRTRTSREWFRHPISSSQRPEDRAQQKLGSLVEDSERDGDLDLLDALKLCERARGSVGNRAWFSPRIGWGAAIAQRSRTRGSVIARETPAKVTTGVGWFRVSERFLKTTARI